MTDIYGLGTALITPFDLNGQVDFAALDRLLDLQLGGDVDFLVVLGTTGEPATMTQAECEAVRRHIVERVAGHLPLVLGMGGNCTAAVVAELTARAEEIRRDYCAILSVCPYYNKPNQEGMYRHFSAIAEASPVPVVLYNVPGRTGVNLRPETVLRLHEHYAQQIVGIKEASGKTEQISQLLRLAPKTLAVLSGDDGLALQVMQQGGAGLISVASNALPHEMHEIVHHQNAELHQQLGTLFKQLFEEGNPAGIKTVLEQMHIIENVLRLPLVPCSRTLQRQIADTLSVCRR